MKSISYQWEDKNGNIERYRKRYRREAGFLAVCMRVPGVPPDNNPVERSNRKVVAARSDGGGKPVREGDGGKLDPVHEHGHGLACGQELL